MRGEGSFTRSRSVVAIGSIGPESAQYGTGPVGTHSDCRAGAHAPFAAGRCRAPDPAMFPGAFQRFCGNVMARRHIASAERKVISYYRRLLLALVPAKAGTQSGFPLARE